MQRVEEEYHTELRKQEEENSTLLTEERSGRLERFLHYRSLSIIGSGPPLTFFCSQVFTTANGISTEEKDERKPLYDAKQERENCGVGLVAHIKGG